MHLKSFASPLGVAIYLFSQANTLAHASPPSTQSTTALTPTATTPNNTITLATIIARSPQRTMVPRPLPGFQFLPRCYTSNNPNICYLGSVWFWRGEVAAYSIFRNTCALIGYNPAAPLKDAGDKFAMNSQLKFVVDIYWLSYRTSPWLRYKGKWFSAPTGETRAGCYQDDTFGSRGFYCMTPFIC